MNTDFKVEATAEDFSDLASAIADTFAMDLIRQHGGIAKAFAALQSAERERCAKIVQAKAESIGRDDSTSWVIRNIADEIRNLN